MDKQKTLITIVVAIVLVFGAVGAYKYAFEPMLKQVKATSAEEVQAYPKELELTQVNLEDLKQANQPIIIDMGSIHCGPCEQMKPELIAAWKELKGKATVRFLDVWEHPDAAKDYPLRVIPSQMLVNADGTPFKAPKDFFIPVKEYTDKNTGKLAYTLHEGMLTQEEIVKLAQEMTKAQST